MKKCQFVPAFIHIVDFLLLPFRFRKYAWISFSLFSCCCFLIRYNNGKEEKSNRFLSPTLETAAYTLFGVWSNKFISTCKIPGRNSRTRHQWKILIDIIATHYMPIAWLCIIVQHALGNITFHKTGKSDFPKRIMSYKHCDILSGALWQYDIVWNSKIKIMTTTTMVRLWLYNRILCLRKQNLNKIC